MRLRRSWRDLWRDLGLWQTLLAAYQEHVMDPFLEPGVLVRHPDQPDWGLGQVQSVIGHRVTVNFEDAGKQTVDATRVALVFVGDDPRGS
jgi:hypothetical protein